MTGTVGYASDALRELLANEGLVVAPGAVDAMSARLVERHSFEAVYMTGFGVALAKFGLPDVGLLTMTEMASSAQAIADAVSIPLIADADTGYGNELNVRRTIREYERAGVAAIQLEDQVMPKKCGHLRGKSLVSQQEMASKVRAASDARRDGSLVIIARTDALAVTGMEDALRRCRAYVAAGADVIFVEAPTTVEQIKRIPSEFDVPVLLNLASSGKTPYLAASALESYGYRLAIYPNFMTLAAITAMNRLLDTLRATGDVNAILELCGSFEEMLDLAGLPAVQALERRYGFDEARLTEA